MSANIKKWQERRPGGALDSREEYMQEEINDLRAALQAQQGEAKAPAPICQSCHGAKVVGTPGRKCPFCAEPSPFSPKAPAPCDICHGVKGGVRGNNAIIDGNPSPTGHERER